jgi:hypothetical protein
MKLFVLGTIVLATVVTAGLAAQGGAAEQTIMGCVAGEGTEASPWMLTGVVIPPPPAAPAGGPLRQLARLRLARRAAAVMRRLARPGAAVPLLVAAAGVQAAGVARPLLLHLLPLRRTSS